MNFLYLFFCPDRSLRTSVEREHFNRPEFENVPPAFRRKAGFTILELLVATTILALLMALILSVISHTSTIWKRSADKIETFQAARMAFNLVTAKLSQATMNTYLDFDNPSVPTKFIRKAELKFLSLPAGSIAGTVGTGQEIFFQAPGNLTRNSTQYGGLEGLLNTCGYYVSFGSDASMKPGFITSANKYRYRLMQLLVPTENNQIYNPNVAGRDWVATSAANVMPVADNIIALIIRPQDPGANPPDLTPNSYTYDSAASFTGNQPLTSNQMPPVIQVTMIAIDSSAAERLQKNSTQPTEITSVLSGKFSNPASYDADIQALELAFNQANPSIPYRIFNSAVPIRESKWTK